MSLLRSEPSGSRKAPFNEEFFILPIGSFVII